LALTVTLEAAVDQVAAAASRQSRRPLLIAIDGPSAAGTSALADSLAGRLGASVLRGDDFYRDMPDEHRWNLDAAEGADRYFDWQRMRRQALEPLRRGEPARFRPYDWRAGGGLCATAVEVGPAAIVIVEGVYSARPEFGALIDLTVLVDTPADERLRRLRARDHGNDRWWPRWSAAEDHYFTSVRPPASFDLVVPGA
jgi:uridine kinase